MRLPRPLQELTVCGIAGFLSADRNVLASAVPVVSRMADQLTHRGPDAAGTWTDADCGIALGHRRLSIIDLSPAGHQPMVSASGRYVSAFNGEIYNHREIRAELEGCGQAPSWRGHSDTETLLAAVEAWGLEGALTRSVGMFALAIWDARERALFLARDRLGEKPLYYGWCGGGFVFASELKAIRAYPSFGNPVSRQAVAEYMRFMYVPAPLSIYEEIYKLDPGCMLRVRGVPAPRSRAPRPGLDAPDLSLRQWWNLQQVIADGARHPISDAQEAAQALEAQLRLAVQQQSLADVPLGAFLSGGVDSSTIAALMQAQSARPIKTFTVGFEDRRFDESAFSKAVAAHLGTDHTELFVRSAEAQAVIPTLPRMYDEPFADSSQIPTHLVCRAARQVVTVALSGDAGDELFGGYNRYFWGPKIWDRVSWMPFATRRTLGAAISSVSSGNWDAMAGVVNRVLPGSMGISHLGHKAHKMATRLKTVRGLEDLYTSLVSEWQDPAEVVKFHEGGAPKSDAAWDPLSDTSLDAAQLRMMAKDTLTYLPDDILCKVDRAAMAISLETRVPFLDHRVVELAWRFSVDLKVRRHEGKWILRQVLYKYVPRSLIERPKTGFGIPIGEWLRGPLRSWAEDLLQERRLAQGGFFHPAPIRQRWLEHLSGRRDHTYSLWAVLMFEAWLDETHRGELVKDAPLDALEGACA
jgi:asparagine synthase (glutamine-hydrolysing)